jgi:choline dehydrogenase-like flavoprotein
VGASDQGTDVLIVGSGPVGATFARILFERVPRARIEMVDLGPRLTPVAGTNVRNIEGPAERADARRRSQGLVGVDRQGVVRPGTHRVDGDAGGMPSAAHSSNVGGMGAHWSCATPRPAGTERIDAVHEQEWDHLLQRAERLLSTSRMPFAMTTSTHEMLEKLGGVFDARLRGPRKVASMPLACVPSDDGRPIRWAGTDLVLGPLAGAEASGRFTLRADTVCRRLEAAGGRVTRAVLHDLRTGRDQMLSARVVVVAADALRTPQLLWASGIRPPALGHYLNDQPQLIATVVGPRGRQGGSSLLWVPFDDAGHPHHGQVMQLEATSLALLDGRGRDRGGETPLVLSWFCRKEIGFDDRVEFSFDDLDGYGLPAIKITYGLTTGDRDAIASAMGDLALAGASLGRFVDEPTLLPAGSSLHYQGTVRMGDSDDGSCVCDSYSRVWGFENLYVGGNGVIPTATACNPTLTSVALAARSAEQIAQALVSDRARRRVNRRAW